MISFLLERFDFAIALQSRYQFYKSFWICNLDRLSMVSVYSIALKWSSLQKWMSKCTQKFLYKIGSWCQFGKSCYLQIWRSLKQVIVVSGKPIVMCNLISEDQLTNIFKSLPRLERELGIYLWFFYWKDLILQLHCKEGINFINPFGFVILIVRQW